MQSVIAVLEAMISSAKREGSIKEKEMNTDNFVIHVAKVYQWMAIAGTVFFFAFAAFVFFASRGDYNPTAGLVVSLVIAAIALYFLYLSAYHILYETHITGNEISHRELFYRRYTFTFDEIKKVQLSRKGLGTFLTVYSETETLFVVEPNYIGYNLLVNRLKREGVNIEK